MYRITVLFLVSCFACQASADDEIICPERPPDEDDQKALAGVWFKKGEKLVDEEKYDDAVEAFECSISMVEHPSTIYNAAQAARLGKQHQAALDLLQRWLKLSPYDDMTDQVLAQIAELEELLEKDGPEEPPPHEDPEPGTGGEYVEDPDGRDDAPSDGSALAVAGWTVFGVGAAAAIAGGVFQGLAAKSEADAESTGDLDEFEDLQLKTDIFQKTAIAAFVVGGVALGAGVTMIVLGSGDDDGAEVAIVPAPGGLLLQGSF